MRFQDIPGKPDTKQYLCQLVQRDRLPHAQIFLGKDGSGSLALALAFASYILCENRTDTDSCGTCRHCSKSYKLVHPDLHFSYPVVKAGDKKRADTTSDDFLPLWREQIQSNPFFDMTEWLQTMGAENTLPNINVKECNDIMHKLTMMSYESDHKILIMWQPEYLGTEGNRLLKLIEEPTDNTTIMLVATQQEAILQTIISRCQLVQVPPFDPSEITAYLRQEINLPQWHAEQVANLSDGNLQYALQVGKNEAADYSDLLISWLRIAFKSDPVEINSWIASVTELTKEEQKNFFEYGLHFFRQCTWMSLVGKDYVRLTDKEQGVAAKISAFLNAEITERIVALLEEALENLNRNINIKIMLFSDTLEVGAALRSKKA